MKINIEAERINITSHYEKMGACYNYSSGVAGEIKDPQIKPVISRTDAMGNPVMRRYEDRRFTGTPNGGPDGRTR